MKRGISTNRMVGAFADCLAISGINFVVRYYSQHTIQPQKRLTLDEARRIAENGLQIAVVYEDNPTVETYFSSGRGRLDATYALSYASSAIMQLPGSAIYFAVDYDAPHADILGPI